MFKDFLEKKLEDKGKQIEQKSKIDEEVVQLKFKDQETFPRRQATYSKATEADKNR